jgi:ketosteroid isomerase-like protein
MGQKNYTADQQHDVNAIDALRNQFLSALITGKPEDLAPLITDDYVYYQPNFEGPSTYGKQPHLNYIRSLPKVHEAEIRLLDFILMGRWAFETGEECYQESTAEGGRVDQVARFVRLLYRTDTGVWQMARTARGMAMDLHCVRHPPAPEFIFNCGRGSWQPMSIDIEVLNETESFIAADQESLRQMARDLDPGSLSVACSVQLPPDHRFVSLGGVYTLKDYNDWQKINIATNVLDDLQKHNEDARVIVPGQWAYSMGKGMGIGVLDKDGAAVRRGGIHFYFYLWQRIDDGHDPWPWKIHSSLSGDMVNPFGALDPQNPTRSDVAHRIIQRERSTTGQPRPRNQYSYTQKPRSAE